jgi:hypothetical protein
LAAAVGLWLSAGSARAETLSMPTSQGPVDFDSASFAYALLAGPDGSYGCFTAGTLSACTPATLQAAVLGPDLSTGLTLGAGAVVTLAVPANGPGLALWEAGNFTLAGDAWDALVAVHTSASWSAERSVSPGHLAPVLNDTMPSGYGTNYATFSADEFGLPANSVFDAVRIRSCCGLDSHFDLLAVAVVPEPGTALLFGVGVLGCTLARRWSFRRPEPASAPC